MERCDWADLPEAVRREVGRQCGPIGQVRPVAAGMNNAAAGAIELSGGGAVFYKGIHTDDPRVWMFRNEIVAAASGQGPRFRWVVEVEGWLLLGWDHIAGRHPDLSPGSPDLDLVAAALRDLAAAPAPASDAQLSHQAQRWEQMTPWHHLAADPPPELDPWVHSNLDQFAADEDHAFAELVGDHLAHTDLHELNILIGDGSAQLIDWAWARRAAPWVDAEMITLRLIVAGHTCDDAAKWRLSSLPHPDLDLGTRQRFAVEMLGTWLRLAMLRPSRPLFSDMAGHALEWAKYLRRIE
jgi:hypothetical protein